MSEKRTLVLFTKPARPGEVKTRLIGALSADQAAELHAAFRDDLLERLTPGPFETVIAWALQTGEGVPGGSFPGMRQRGIDLGERMFLALSEAGQTASTVAAVGSDHPLLGMAEVEAAFLTLEAGADMVFGPATDGGYYLVAARRDALTRRVFEEIPWSTSRVLEVTLERCREAGVRVELLAEASDVDTPDDLDALCRALQTSSTDCPRTRRLLLGWGRLRPGAAVSS